MHPSDLAPATTVGYSVRVAGVDVFHVGIVTERTDHRGLPYVISASKRSGMVLEEPWEDFHQGASVRLVDLRGDLDAQEVIGRARERVGHVWSLFFANCEHFVRWAHGIPEESPQLQRGVAAVATGVVVTGSLVLLVGAIVDALATPKRRR